MVRLLVLCALIAAPVAARAASLSAALQSLEFRHAGTVHATDSFARGGSNAALYLECENCTRSQFSWADKKYDPLWVQSDACVDPGPVQPGYDRKGSDLNASTTPASSTACQALCCGQSACRSWVWAPSAPADFLQCKAGQPCCYLKSSVPVASRSSIDGLISGVPSYAAPPLGMRSSVPLGGIGAGVVELRGDGSLHEWTIANQSPGGAAKIQLLDDAMFGLRLGRAPARVVRTHPPRSAEAAGAAGIAAATYSGAYPVTRLGLDLSPGTAAAPAPNATLFAHSRLRANDMEYSAAPAVAFTLLVGNPKDNTDGDLTASFMFNLPLSVEQDTARAGGKPVGGQTSVTDPAACFRRCQQTPECASWSAVPGGGDALLCSLASDVPLNAFVAGASSGVKGTWEADGNDCLTLSRPGTGPAHGNLSLCAVADDAAARATVAFATGDTFGDVWASFAGDEVTGTVDPASAYGAATVTASGIAPGTTAALTIVMSWYLPHRDYMGVDIGNHYAALWADSASVGRAVTASLVADVGDIAALHTPFLGSSLPDWLQDGLVNSLSHFRTGWWRENGATGPSWRQWEAADCVNIDSIHNDGERHLPYLMTFPNMTRSKLDGWGASQQTNGMLTEQLGCGCMAAVDKSAAFDAGCGRVMSDVSSMFILYLVELGRWGGDAATVARHWPVAKRAAQWHLDQAAGSGLLEKMCNTYDIAGPQNHRLVAYNEVFHLVALAAAEALASSDLIGDQPFAATLRNASAAARAALDRELWTEAGQRQWWAFSDDDKTSLMADSLYPQLLAFASGLDLGLEREKISAHLETEMAWNDGPFGISLLTTGHGAELVELGGGGGNGVWQMANPDWAALSLWNAAAAADDSDRSALLERALNTSKKTVDTWRELNKDLWNVAGISETFSGRPTITSHYGYWMTVWHLPLAISGQQADFLEANSSSLIFAPKLEAAGDAFSLPVILPGTVGTISSADGTTFVLRVSAGKPLPALARLAVGDAVYPGAVKSLAAGESVSWS